MSLLIQKLLRLVVLNCLHWISSLQITAHLIIEVLILVGHWRLIKVSLHVILVVIIVHSLTIEHITTLIMLIVVEILTILVFLYIIYLALGKWHISLNKVLILTLINSLSEWIIL